MINHDEQPDGLGKPIRDQQSASFGGSGDRPLIDLGELPRRRTSEGGVFVMQKSPAFQLYPKDLLADTAWLTNEEFGVYVRLLLYAWIGLPGCCQGQLPSKTMALLSLLRISEQDWERISPNILQYFSDSGDGFLTQNRMINEIKKQKERSKAKQKAGLAGARARWQNDSRAIAESEPPAIILPVAKNGSSSSSSSSCKRQNLSRSKRTSVEDPRHGPLRAYIRQCWEYCNAGRKTPWDGRTANAMARFLRSHRDVDGTGWDLATLKTCVAHRFRSEGANLSEPPVTWIGKLPKWLASPLDRYGNPLNHAEAQTAKVGANRIDPPVKTKTLPEPPEWFAVFHSTLAEIAPREYETWFAPLKFVADEEGVVKFSVPNETFVSFIASLEQPWIAKALAASGKGGAQIVYELDA